MRPIHPRVLLSSDQLPHPDPPLSRSHFLAWCRKRQDTLVPLRLLETSSRVELQVRPRRAEEEATIIEALMTEYDPGRPGRRGQRWYLLPFSWWSRWCEFTRYKGPAQPSRPDATPQPLTRRGATRKEDQDPDGKIVFNYRRYAPQVGGDGGVGPSPGAIDQR